MATSEEFIERFRSLIAQRTKESARVAAIEARGFIASGFTDEDRRGRYEDILPVLQSALDPGSGLHSPEFGEIVRDLDFLASLRDDFGVNTKRLGEALEKPSTQGSTSEGADRVIRQQAPTSSSSADVSAPGGILRSGDSGADVRALQRLLNANGARLTVDGQFGPKTAEALRSYQRANGLTVDGIYGPETRSSFTGGGSAIGSGGGGSSGGGSSTGGGSTGGGSTGGGGGSTSTGGGGGPSDRLPGGYEVWNIGGDLHAVWTLPGSTTPMAWRIDGNADVILGDHTISRTMNSREAASQGVLVMGRHSDLKNTEKDPFDNFLDTIEERSRTEPWLTDPEVIVQSAEAYLEGREVTLNDLAETDWYNSQTDKERAWVKFAAQASDAEVQQAIQDRQLAVRDMLLQAGVSDPPPQLVDYLTRQDLTGKFSDAEFTQQITAIADPYSGIELDPGIQEALQGIDLVTKASDVRAMRERVKQWLGPFADNYTDEQLAEWSGMVRNDPNGERKLEDILKGQRLALLPEYDNPDVKWADAAAPWKSYISQQWGEQIDDSDPLLLNVVRANDINEAGRMLRREGVKRGVGGAVNDLTGALSKAFGSNVRRSL